MAHVTFPETAGVPADPARPPRRPPASFARTARVLALVAAAALLTAGLMHPLFRNAEGHLGARFILALGFAVAAAVLGLSGGSRWERPGRWFALALAGQAAALQLIQAGPRVAHQHYLTPGELLAPEHLPALLFILLQALLVVTAAGRRLGRSLRTARSALGAWGVLLVAAVFVLPSATLSARPEIYLSELLFASFVQAINLGTLLLAVSSIPADSVSSLARRFNRVLGEHHGSSEPGGADGFAIGAALWVLSVCAVLAWFSYQNHPHVPDEVVYLYHARYFAQGMLTMPLPPVPAAFDLDLMTFEATRWYSPVPPGWPAALAVGVYFGAAWLVNPVLNAVNVLLAYVVLREFHDMRTARTALLLLCASPWFLFMGMNFMTHTFTLSCALAAAVAVAKLRRGRSVSWALPGGVAIGIMGMIRPLEGLMMAVLLGLWGVGRPPWRAGAVVRIAVLAIVAIAAGALTLPYNAYLAGDPLTFPLMAYTDSVYGPDVNALGFGANRGIGWPGLDPFPGHGLIDVLVNANLNTHGVNVELLGWSIGSLLPIGLLLAIARPSASDLCMMAVIGATIAVHSFYWFSGGPDFGARYWYLVLVPCIALTARAVAVIGERFAQAATDARADATAAAGAGPVAVSAVALDVARARVLAGMLALAAVALVCFVPWRAIDKYHYYRNMRPDVRQMADTHEFGRSLVLVRGNRHPDYASAAIYNPLDIDADAPIYVWDRDADVTRAVIQAFPDRPLWILDGPTRTGAGYRVVDGPIAPGAVPESLPRP